MLKVGVVGIGHMGKYHVNLLSQSSKAKLHAVCDIDQSSVDEISSRYGIKGYTDYKRFLSAVDAVVIAVPTYLHYKYASEALMAGCPILLEKPITKTVYYAEKLVNLAEQKNLFLQVGHVERFNAAVSELKNIVKDPYFIHAERMGPPSRITDVGVVLDLMIHDIDIACQIAGSEPLDIQAHGTKVYSEFEDLANASILFENGVIANLTASRVSQNKSRLLTLSQKDSFVSLDFATQDITIIRQPQAAYEVMKEEIKYKQESLVERVFIHKGNALQLEIDHFIDCVGGKEPIHTPEADLTALKAAKRVMDGIYRSWGVTMKEETEEV